MQPVERRVHVAPIDPRGDGISVKVSAYSETGCNSGPTGWQWSYRRRQPVELDASAVFKSDVAMRARAYKALVDGGMTPAMAAAFAGLVEADNG